MKNSRVSSFFENQKSAFIVLLLITTSTGAAPATVSLDAHTTRRLESSDWRVRYCLATEKRIGTNADRAVLEQLIRDSNQSVGNQAAVSYLYTFVKVDRQFLREHVSLFYDLPVGFEWRGTPDISSVEFHRAFLKTDRDHPVVASNIQAIGILGNETDIPVLRPFLSAQNPYVAHTAAVALARLGSKEEAVAALHTFVEGPSSSESLYYQIEALRILAEVDTPYFRRTLGTFSKGVKEQDYTTPALWWWLVQIAWSQNVELN